jgi:hypothetical protein
MLGKQQESGGEEARSTGWITAAFLTVCGLCGRALGPGKDTYIYRYTSPLLDRSALSSTGSKSSLVLR